VFLRTILAWLAAVPWAGWALGRALGAERGFPLVPLMAFAPYAALGALAAAVLALVLRRRLPAVAALAAAAVLAAAVAPRVLADPGTDRGAAAGPSLRVLTANTAYGSVPADELVRLVRTQRVDVLSLQELTPALDRALAAAGLARLLPGRVALPRSGAGGAALYARLPLRAVRSPPTLFAAPAAVLHVPGAPPVQLTAVHPPAPQRPGLVGPWRRDLRSLPAAGTPGRLRILAGDFNATLDHAELRRLLATGYDDAADEAGAGLEATWPSNGRLPGVAIDHVLADARCGVRAVSVLPLPRSDHRAVLAELVLPRG
jgi:endonuclease/exonuclease/phosphatase (EEP) superfamily protein YafD